MSSQPTAVPSRFSGTFGASKPDKVNWKQGPPSCAECVRGKLKVRPSPIRFNQNSCPRSVLGRGPAHRVLGEALGAHVLGCPVTPGCYLRRLSGPQKLNHCQSTQRRVGAQATTIGPCK